MEGGDPTALSMEPSLAGLMNARADQVSCECYWQSGMATAAGRWRQKLQVSMQANGSRRIMACLFRRHRQFVAPAADARSGWVWRRQGRTGLIAQTASAPSAVSTAACGLCQFADGKRRCARDPRHRSSCKLATSATAANSTTCRCCREVQTVAQTTRRPAGTQSCP